MTTFDSLIPGESYARAVDASGKVVGYADFSHGYMRAFLYDADGVVDLGTLGGNKSHAAGINETGQIVGWAQRSDGSGHACLWNDGTITDLGTLGGESSYARAINDLGVIVGDSYTSSGQRHMVLWDEGRMLDINELILNADGWESIDIPAAINNAGQIVGSARFNGERRAYLLTPLVPEPRAVALLGTACAACWMIRGWRRRRGRQAG